jgi:hypothetical protein
MMVRNGLAAVIHVGVNPPKAGKSGAAPPQGSFEPFLVVKRASLTE